MATFKGQNKSSNVVFRRYAKAGSGWLYDQEGITYDGEFDDHGRQVLYDSIGTLPVLTGQAKSSNVTLTPANKS